MPDPILSTDPVEAMRRALLLSTPGLSRFDPLPRLIAYDDFAAELLQSGNSNRIGIRCHGNEGGKLAGSSTQLGVWRDPRVRINDHTDGNAWACGTSRQQRVIGKRRPAADHDCIHASAQFVHDSS